MAAAAPPSSADTTLDLPASDTPQRARGFVGRQLAILASLSGLASPWWIVPIVPAVEAIARSWPAVQDLPTNVLAVALAHLAGRRFGIAALPAIYTLALFFVAAVPALYAPGNWWTIPALLIAARLGYDAELRGAIVASGRPPDRTDGSSVRLRWIHPMVGEWPDGGVLGALLVVFVVSLRSFAPDFALFGDSLATLVPLLCGILGARQVPLRSLLPAFIFFAACLWLAAPFRPDARIAADLLFWVGSWPPLLFDCVAALLVGRALSRPRPLYGVVPHYARLGFLLLLWSAVLLAVHTGFALRIPDPLRGIGSGEIHSLGFRLHGWTLPMLVAVLCWSVDDLRDEGAPFAARLGRAIGLAAVVYALVSAAAEYVVPVGLTVSVDGWQREDRPAVALPPVLLACVAAMLFFGWLRRNPLPVATGANPAGATLAALLGRFWTVAAFGTPLAVLAMVAALMLASLGDPMAAFRRAPAPPPLPAAIPSAAAEPTATDDMPAASSSATDTSTPPPPRPAAASAASKQTGARVARSPGGASRNYSSKNPSGNTVPASELDRINEVNRVIEANPQLFPPANSTVEAAPPAQIVEQNPRPSPDAPADGGIAEPRRETRQLTTSKSSRAEPSSKADDLSKR